MGVTTYFFDTYAVIELLKGNPKYLAHLDNQVTITIFNLAEIYFSALKEYGEQRAKEVYHSFAWCVVDVPEEVMFDAMKFKLNQKRRHLSYTDCIGYSYARHHRMRFLTGDKEFEGVEGVEFIKA